MEFSWSIQTGWDLTTPAEDQPAGSALSTTLILANWTELNWTGPSHIGTASSHSLRACQSLSEKFKRSKRIRQALVSLACEAKQSKTVTPWPMSPLRCPALHRGIGAVHLRTASRSRPDQAHRLPRALLPRPRNKWQKSIDYTALSMRNNQHLDKYLLKNFTKLTWGFISRRRINVTFVVLTKLAISHTVSMGKSRF